MSIARPAAEIEPHLSMFSSNAIFPGPIRPSGSRSMRTLREGSAFDFCMEEFNSPIANGSFFKRTGSRFASEQAPLNPFTGRWNRLHTRMNTEFYSEMNYPSLFSPLKLGPYQLDHRLVLAPLTRMRAEKPSLAPRPLNAEYYAQRATPGGLLIAEASPVLATGFGSPGVPGIYTEQQVLQRGFPLTPFDRKTFYGGDVAGYTDYPVHDELAQA